MNRLHLVATADKVDAAAAGVVPGETRGAGALAAGAGPGLEVAGEALGTDRILLSVTVWDEVGERATYRCDSSEAAETSRGAAAGVAIAMLPRAARRGRVSENRMTAVG